MLGRLKRFRLRVGFLMVHFRTKEPLLETLCLYGGMVFFGCELPGVCLNGASKLSRGEGQIGGKKGSVGEQGAKGYQFGASNT